MSPRQSDGGTMSAIATRSPITEIEAQRLARCEETISRGLETFVKVGRALAEIRDRRLYRAKYGTFDAYVAARWGMSRTRAYEFIAAGEVVETVTTTSATADIAAPRNEAVARELAPLRRQPEAMREAWAQTVAEHGETPTAQQVRQHVEPRRSAKARPGRDVRREPAPRPVLTPQQTQVADAHMRRMDEEVLSRCARLRMMAEDGFCTVSPEEIAKVASVEDMEAMATEIRAGWRALDQLLDFLLDKIDEARAGGAR